jgi:hypothetical protein
MGFRRKIGGLSLSCVMAAAIGVGTIGTAQATINNDPGTAHWENLGDNRKCLTNDPSSGFVVAWRCLNAQSEEWSAVGPPNSPFNMVNFWTGDCMAPTGYPANGTLITEVPCNTQDAKQLWRTEFMENFNGTRYYRLHSVLNGDMCLDKPDGVNDDGTRIQMWKCASQDHDPLDPVFNYHKEQYWGSF